MLIHHTIEYDFDLDFADIQQEAVNSIKREWIISIYQMYLIWSIRML